MVAKGVEHIAEEEKQVGGQLGRPSGARFRTYERLKRHADKVKGTLFDLPELGKADRRNLPLPAAPVGDRHAQPPAEDRISDDKLAELVLALREEDRLCLIQDEEHSGEPQIICSLGLARLTA